MADSNTDRLHFEELRIGDTWLSPRRTITETDVVNFAGLTGDYNPLHIDHEFAKETPFGKPIAHGLLGLAVMAGLSSASPTVHTAAFLGIRHWQFHRPIFFGDTIQIETEVMDKDRTGRKRGRVIWHCRILNQQGEVVQEGELETLVMLANVKSSDGKSTSRDVNGENVAATAR